MTDRKELSTRRSNITETVRWDTRGVDQKLIVTFGIVQGRVVEAFCSGFRASTDICALANDACILLSLLLQDGADIKELAPKLGEDRAEGASRGPPSSLIGAIVIAGARIQHDIFGNQ